MPPLASRCSRRLMIGGARSLIIGGCKTVFSTTAAPFAPKKLHETTDQNRLRDANEKGRLHVPLLLHLTLPVALIARSEEVK